MTAAFEPPPVAPESASRWWQGLRFASHDLAALETVIAGANRESEGAEPLRSWLARATAEAWWPGILPAGAAGRGFSVTRVCLLLDELAKRRPDGAALYCGHARCVGTLAAFGDDASAWLRLIGRDGAIGTMELAGAGAGAADGAWPGLVASHAGEARLSCVVASAGADRYRVGVRDHGADDAVAWLSRLPMFPGPLSWQPLPMAATLMGAARGLCETVVGRATPDPLGPVCELWATIEATRSLVYRAARSADGGETVVRLAAASLLAAERSCAQALTLAADRGVPAPRRAVVERVLGIMTTGWSAIQEMMVRSWSGRAGEER